ncbi:MAG TPA: TIGR03667 family PPOX class F420-dependent oxidoreductase [Anaerolineae bacterium]|jgi:PPOX class probable F420-dependent enzyme|nr:TIGR03667 family PPOX class F420-dependent oxidoreductase [Anaerolineae bacterium]
MLDTRSEFGRRVTRRLGEERIIWLSTTGADDYPQPRPVWFLWDGESFLIYSRPGTAKLKHIAARPKVALNFDGDGQGGDIVVFTGRAAIDASAPPADQLPAYSQKYRAGFQRLNMSAADFAQDYSVAIRVWPEALRGH